MGGWFCKYYHILSVSCVARTFFLPSLTYMILLNSYNSQGLFCGQGNHLRGSLISRGLDTGALAGFQCFCPSLWLIVGASADKSDRAYYKLGARR